MSVVNRWVTRIENSTLERCRYHGDAGMKRWVGWGVIAHNLRVIAEHRAAQATR